MFMNENICTLVDLFDKAVAEGASNHCGHSRQDLCRLISTNLKVSNLFFFQRTTLTNKVFLMDK